MGNWRRVHIIGTCNKDEVSFLYNALDPKSDYSNFYCLCYSGGLYGLPNWATENIDVVGNLAERDYSIESIVGQVKLISERVPSLKIKIHCGDDYESDECVNTIMLENSIVILGVPEVEKISEIPISQTEENFFYQIARRKIS